MANKLTNLQWAYIANRASGMNQADAYLASGSRCTDPEAAKRHASRLEKHPAVAEKLSQVAKKAEAIAIGSKREALNLIWETMQQANEASDRPNVYKGAELWLKATGQLVEKQQIEQTSTEILIEWDGVNGGLSQ